MISNTVSINHLKESKNWETEPTYLTEKPFSIISYNDTDIPNIKFTQNKSLEKKLFETITSELKENKWKYIKEKDVWVPTKDNSKEFAYNLQKKYFPDSIIDEQYNNVIFFDRNYSEIEEFKSYFNKYKNTLPNSNEDITSEEAWTILSAINHDNNSVKPNERNYRLGVDKDNTSQLILVEKINDTYLQRPINLTSILDKAYLNTIINKKNIQKVLKEQSSLVSDEINSLFSDIWKTCKEKTADAYKEVGRLYSKYIGKNTIPIEKPLTINLGDSINDQKITSLNYITDNIYQIETEKSLFPTFAIDKCISLQCNEELMKNTVDYGEFVVIENKAAEPYVIYELINKGLMPARTEDFYNKLSNFVKNYPAKYIQLYPITADNFLPSFAKYVDIENRKDKSVMELASELIKLVEPQEKPHLDKLLRAQGINNPQKLEEVLNFEIEKHNLKKNNLDKTFIENQQKGKEVYER